MIVAVGSIRFLPALGQAPFVFLDLFYTFPRFPSSSLFPVVEFFKSPRNTASEVRLFSIFAFFCLAFLAGKASECFFDLEIEDTDSMLPLHLFVFFSSLEWWGRG